MDFMDKARVKSIAKARSRVPLKVFISPEAKSRLKHAAKGLTGVTMANMVEDLIMDNLPQAPDPKNG
jgi:hypothetical protein